MNPSPKKYDMAFKIVLLGDSAVGKTSIINAYITRVFREQEASTVGAAYFTKLVEFDTNKVQIEIWDTAGQERFQTIAPMYYRKASGILLVYDITNRQSFERVKYWISEIESIGNPHCIIFLLGNKIDLEADREIPTEDANQLAKKHKLEHYEVTAKEPEKIDTVMMDMVKKLMARFVTISKDRDILLKQDKNQPPEKQKAYQGCC